MKRLPLATALSVALFGTSAAYAGGDFYADFPVTLQGYQGDESHSVSYPGQIARHVLHDSLKKLSGRSTGDNAAEIKAQMMAYFKGDAEGRAILAPTSKAGFEIKQDQVDQLSKGKNLADKAYKGAVPGWPGNMSGEEVLAFMLDKAANNQGGYDSVNGMDYIQLLSKTAMGAVFYNQAVDVYLDERLEADRYPNDQPYKKGRHYTGKEHVWDEAFGYFGVPAHTMNLDAKTVYAITKGKPEAFKAADANGDGVVDLLTEMAFAHGYYAAAADKGGKSNYLKTITQAFIDGRQLIADAQGEVLTDAQRARLKAYADTIKSNWEKVIAEAVYKYAGSVYQDLKKIEIVIETNGDIGPVMRDYAKHWGELKGFALALQMGGKDLGATALQLNRLIGFSPVLLGNTQVTGIDANGDYIQAKSIDMGAYMGNMIQVQALLDEQFGLAARSNQIGDSLSALNAKLKSKETGEND